MADGYSHTLLVQLEENNTPRLKNKLVKYFQSKRSNGGDCEVDYDNGSRTAVVRFRREDDQKNVLAKEAHQISLDQGVLRMTVRLPTEEPEEPAAPEAPSDKPNKRSAEDVVTIPSVPEKRTRETNVEREVKDEDEDEEAADEELCSAVAVLENIPEDATKEFMEMLVENIVNNPDSPSDAPSFTLEEIPDISSAVVTFQTAEENTCFVTRCPRNRTFMKKKLSVRPLEATKKVLVEDLRNISEDRLQLYFDNAGGDVELVELNEEEQSAIITFQDHKAVQKVLKKKHRIRNEEIRVYPFYKSLGTALYGKDKPSLKLPAAISEPIDSALWRYLQGSQSAAETIRSHLVKHFCNVNLNQTTVCLSPVSSLLQQKDAKDIIKAWRDTVKSAFAQALSKFRSLKLPLGSEVWEKSEEEIREMLQNESVVVTSDKANGVLSVVGLTTDINRLEETLSEVVNTIVKKAHREKESVTQEIKLSPSIFHVLCQDGLQDKLLKVYPELKMLSREDSLDLRITGLKDEILAANKVICDAVVSLKRQDLEIDNFVLEVLKGEKQEELTRTLLTSNGIKAAFEIQAQRVQLLAVYDRDLNDAKDLLGKLLVSQYLDVEDSGVLRKPEWKHLVSHLENANSTSSRRIRIQTSGQQVVVAGFKDCVKSVSRDLDDFLVQNAQVEETVVVKPNAKVEFIKDVDRSLDKLINKVQVSYKKEAISLSGSRVDVTQCMTLVGNVVSSVIFDCLNVSMPGVKKSFADKESMYVSSILKETGCLVQLVDERSGGQDDLANRQVPQPVYQLQTSEGLEIAVCKADMCSYPVHAVVSSSNPNLKLQGGLAGALLNAAGPQLQDECDNIIQLKGQLKPGECDITGAGGQLCCKNIIHAVGPNFDPAKPQRATAQLKKAVKGSLELAEKNGCVSVALPVISRNQGFPLPLCAVTIIKAVKEHCDEKCDDSILKKIHFVNNDDSTVQAMETAVRQEYGSHGISSSQQTLSSKGTKSPQTVSNTNCLSQVQTKEGLDITLMKGNIENATTEVTVNTVFEDLALNKGAVSNAIFSVAGPKLQQLVTSKNATGKLGEVIVTDGCKLKSKKVFHVVTPHWDQGQGAAEKILSGIFKDCLHKAEDSGLTSISFPAIGTGNLGFPKDRVASVMLDEILEFSRTKQPKHLKKVVIILYTGDAQTLQVFSDEFRKKFPSASGPPAPASSPQSSGPFSKVVSSSGMCETKLGNVTVQVATGDITTETTDVIVNSSNDNFSLKSGVSKAILEAAGQAVEAECQTLGAQPNAGMILTQPGNLKSKKILHLVGQTDFVKIKKVVTEALIMCEKNSHTSVSFPAIGTGQGNVQARQVADAMLDAVIDVFSQKPSSTLKKIRIVIFQPPMLTEFYSSMQQREAATPTDKAGLLGKIGNKIKSFLIGSADKPQEEGDFVIEPVKAEPACFHICGESKAKVDSAKQWINDLITREHSSFSIPDQAILRFSDAHKQRIVDLQKTMSVSIRTESKKGQASMTITGLSNNVLKATDVIHDMLRKVRDEQDLEKKVMLAGKVADWQYKQQGAQFQSLDPKTNFELEQALDKELPSVKVTIQGQTYTVTMPSGPATDAQGRTVEIKRIDKLKGGEELPEFWDTMPANTTSHAVTLAAGTPEYTEVQTLFKTTCTQNIIKIERIQNPLLWKSLEIKKNELELRNGHKNNEKRLFHGTSHDTVAHINDNGFNRSYAGKNATCYGNGTYFAVNANYSAHNTYSRPNQNGEKCMYLCRVLTGDFTTGHQNMIVPPAKGGAASTHKYDSVVDRLVNPSMYIIFHDSQAYPEYLITFK